MRANREDKNTERQFPEGEEEGGRKRERSRGRKTERSRGKKTKRQSEESALYGQVSLR